MATEVVVPMLGVTVERGKIIEWLKKEGDPVAKGEIIFVVEMEKVTTEVESPATGILARILIGEGVEVPVLTVVALITEPGEEIQVEYGALKESHKALREGETIQTETVNAASPLSTKAVLRDSPVKAMPAARKLALEKGVDLNSVAGTGPEGVILFKDIEVALSTRETGMPKASPLARKVAEKEGIPLGLIEGTGVGGRIMRNDVDRALKTSATAGPALDRGEEKSVTPREIKVIPMSTMRKTIACRLAASFFTSPHIYFFADVYMDPLMDLRNQMLPVFEEKFKMRFSINDFLIKAVALNLVDFPMVNSVIKGEEIHVLPDINVCLAIALPEGIIVPAIAHADKVDLADIVRTRRDLVERAYSGKLTMDELERGTFTISSLAQYDITHFTAILNPPQSGILTVGKTRETLSMVDGEIRVTRIMTLGLGVDHRIIDGSMAAEFLQSLKQKLEEPILTFVTFK